MKNLFFSLIVILLLVACSSNKINEDETTQLPMIHPTYSMEDYKFNDIVMDSSLKYFTKQLLANGFKIRKTWIDSEEDNKYDINKITAFSGKKYTDLFGENCNIYVCESIYTGKVFKVLISKLGESDNDDIILRSLKEKYGDNESIVLNSEGKYDYNKKFKVAYYVNYTGTQLTWMNDNNDTILIFDFSPFYIDVEYRNPINYNEHQKYVNDITSEENNNKYKKATNSAKEIL